MQDDSGKPEQSSPAKKSFRITWRWEEINGYSTIIIAIATVVAVFVGWVQWNEVRRTVEISQRQADLAQRAIDISADLAKKTSRAYVVAGQGELKPLRNQTDWFTFTTVWQNIGQTPAYVIDYHQSVLVLPPNTESSDFEAFLKYEPKRNNIIDVIAPGKSVYRPYDYQTKALQDPDYMSGKADVYLFYRIFYRDVHGEMHSSWYCARSNYEFLQHRGMAYGCQVDDQIE